MIRAICSALLLLSLVACGAKQPVITPSGEYQSNEHMFIVSPPEGWTASLDRPDIPEMITPRNRRYTERAYLTKAGLKSVIVVESKRLTWAGRGIHPFDIFFGPGNLDKWMYVCNESQNVLRARAQENRGRNLMYYYKCYDMKNEKSCIMPDLCLERKTVVRMFAAEGEYDIEERSYITGDEPEIKGPSFTGDNGWRIAIVWFGPESESKEAEAAIDFLKNGFSPLPSQ